jgi:hypothetical protein
MRAAKAERIAQSLGVLDPDLASEGEVAEALRDEEVHGSAASWLGAVLLAGERGVPLLCDDRYIRAWVRRLGIPTFGTAALLQALEQRGLLARDDLTAAEWVLRVAGARHLPVMTEHLIARMDADGYRLSPATDALLRDPDGWSTIPDEEFGRWHHALVAIWNERPQLLYPWVAHLVSRVAVATGRPRPDIAMLLMLSAVGGEDRGVGYVRALLAAMRRCTLEAFNVGEPLAAAIEQLRVADVAIEPGVGQIFVVRALSRVPLAEQLRVLGVPTPGFPL